MDLIPIIIATASLWSFFGGHPLKVILGSGIALNMWYLLGQLPSGDTLVAIILVFLLVLFVLCYEPACNRLIRILDTLRKR